MSGEYRSISALGYRYLFKAIGEYLSLISLGLPLSIQGDWRVSEPKHPLVIDDEQYILIDPMFNCITLGLAVMKFLKI